MAGKAEAVLFLPLLDVQLLQVQCPAEEAPNCCVPTQAYIDELAQTLMEGAEDPSTPAHARLLELTKANVGPSLTYMSRPVDVL